MFILAGAGYRQPASGCIHRGGTVIPGRLAVGKTVLSSGGTLDFNDAIDDLRLSNTSREIRGIPAAPLMADAQTIGPWSFDYVEGATQFLDASANSNPMQVSTAESLDEIDRAFYNHRPSPLESDFTAEILASWGSKACQAQAMQGSNACSVRGTSSCHTASAMCRPMSVTS